MNKALYVNQTNVNHVTKHVPYAQIHSLKSVQNAKIHIHTRILILDCVLQHAQVVVISTRRQSHVEDHVQLRDIILTPMNASNVIHPVGLAQEI